MAIKIGNNQTSIHSHHKQLTICNKRLPINSQQLENDNWKFATNEKLLKVRFNPVSH